MAKGTQAENRRHILCGENWKVVILPVFVTFVFGCLPGNGRIYFASSVGAGQN